MSGQSFPTLATAQNLDVYLAYPGSTEDTYIYLTDIMKHALTSANILSEAGRQNSYHPITRTLACSNIRTQPGLQLSLQSALFVFFWE